MASMQRRGAADRSAPVLFSSENPRRFIKGNVAFSVFSVQAVDVIGQGRQVKVLLQLCNDEIRIRAAVDVITKEK